MKVNNDFIIRQIADEYIIVPIGEAVINFNGMITVNEVGKFIWEQLQEDLSQEELLNRITNEYDVDEQTATNDLEEFISRLQQGGLLQQQ
jgi:hypothetical protein